ncbi:plant invertase/pectin methylesterase inhibitor [Striga asiatica]|uniref:Plant invertase/pectin methylesterase inhibitor n=1 Tax=Striga asiatica TaxID=4170 RepID=A0A5A7PAX4_STRAF|nr:plant invertase/pectin methylesterase inhibitor [Striga asiatica]
MGRILILATLSLFLLSTCHADLISDVCSASIYSAFCYRTLRSDPAARAAKDLITLGTVVAGKGKVASHDVYVISKSIGGPGADTCVEVSVDAIDFLDEVLGYLRMPGSGTKDDLLTKGSAALSDLYTCEEDFGRREPGKLKAANAKAKSLDVLSLSGLACYVILYFVKNNAWRPGRVAVGDLQTKASAALSDVATCDDEYEGSGRPEPAKLKAATAKAQGIISILLVIANQL